MDGHSRFAPTPLQLNFFITIARSARVARFVRSRTVDKFTSRINWYWFFHNGHAFNPFWYWRMYRQEKEEARLAKLGVDPESSLKRTSNSRSSKGGFQLGVLAAIKAQAEAEARLAKQTAMSRRFPLVLRFKAFFRALGILGDEQRELQRQIAARKIQRAWREHMRLFAQQPHPGSAELLDGDESLDEAAVSSAFTTTNKRTSARTSNSTGRLSARDQILAGGSRFQSQSGRPRGSQVGSDMRERTGQRVAIGILIALVVTIIFTHTQPDTTRETTMIVLHQQTMFEQFRSQSLDAARGTSVPTLYRYETVNETVHEWELNFTTNLRPYEKLRITVEDSSSNMSEGMFSFRSEVIQAAWSEIVATVLIVLVWCLGVTAFTGPIMNLVVVPIERMVRLLGMLIMDPIGYQNTARFKKFLIEEDKLIKNTRWTKELLRGMETSFLMSTILRIGSLMKVGFGSAGVEIIRNNLQKGQRRNMLNLTEKGITVSCIFLFCDIRQFTDATECLQEEVFVFTNRIAAVVHSICHSYGGAANKNVGDAFLLSWLLEDGEKSGASGSFGTPRLESMKAKTNQADKALLSVIKICIALYYDAYYIETMSEAACKRLQAKLKNRPGPLVQMGFGLHAGRAVQGAIGSERKIDATYVSEAVERAEFLESSTKQYGLKMIMSGSFYQLLHPNTRRRCRKIDQILFLDDEDDDESVEEGEVKGEIVELFTYDMDVDALHRPQAKSSLKDGDSASVSEIDSTGNLDRRNWGRAHRQPSTRQVRRRRSVQALRTSSQTTPGSSGSEEFTGNPGSGQFNLIESGGGAGSAGSIASSEKETAETGSTVFHVPTELVLPSGPALYNHNIWQSPEMKRIRDRFVKGLFFQKYNAGLEAYYNKDWRTAQECFQTIVDNYDDGPSRYFLAQMKKYHGNCPKDFPPYGSA